MPAFLKGFFTCFCLFSMVGCILLAISCVESTSTLYALDAIKHIGQMLYGGYTQANILLILAIQLILMSVWIVVFNRF